ncbi:transcriptional regulator [Streptacidiphilus pinicola]|uniref:Transcriptional regulator n=1 Tax=Streptacidiphilus pinicola TaxID=2219663 RepID=A0A2X0KK43_9ACTN|nr:MerR family transcriptional regulator [Streptacidiphilus pinicola]RAG87329.1 transcriptional regulator [Streptacidiphilus pinicola]
MSGHAVPQPPGARRAEDWPAEGGTGLPTGEVARRLGVSPVTLRSWERRYGIGPERRAEGRHRRWTEADIARLEAMCRLTARGLPPGEAARAVAAGRPFGALLPAAPGTGQETGPGSDAAARRRHARGLIRAADRLDAPTVAELLASALDRWGVESAWTDVIAPTLRATGRRWAALGETYVEVEHLLSWHVSAELRHRAAALPGAGPVALLAATPGEEHTLALDAVAAALAERGVAFRMLGAAVPPLALAQSCRRLGPAAVLLWSQSRDTAAPRLATDLLELLVGVPGARHSPALLLGGPGWRFAGTPGGATAPPSLRAAVEHIAAARGLLPEPP